MPRFAERCPTAEVAEFRKSQKLGAMKLNKVSDAGGGIKRGISKGARKAFGGELAEEAEEKVDGSLSRFSTS